MKSILFLCSVLIILINSIDCQSQISDRVLNYNSVAEEYNASLKNINPDRKKGQKWLYRWLWDNRYDISPDGFLGFLPEFTPPDDSKNNGTEILMSNNGWIPLGPDQMVPSYEERSGHGLGRVNCVAFHPTNQDILWIGTPGGGVWKSENSGKSWTPQSDNLPTLAISHIAVDPKNTEIVYFCSGDFDTGGLTGSQALGIFKTTNGGADWTKLSLGSHETFKNSFLRKIIINPNNTNQLITAGMLGIWKSDDAGQTWNYVLDSLCYDIEMNPSNPEILYVAMGTKYNIFGSAGVLKSTDFGTTWVALDSGIPPKSGVSRMDLEIAPSDPNYIYVLNVNSQNNGFNSIYQSTDGGDTWSLKADRSNAPNILGVYDGGQDYDYGQGWYDLTMLVDPIDKRKIYTGGINIWTSEDEGVTWEIASLWINVFGISIHADHHYSSFNPLNGYIYFCNDGGIYRTKSIQPGKKQWIADYIDKEAEDLKPGSPDNLKFPTVWENLSSGLNITEFYKLNISSKSTEFVTAGAQDNSCYYHNGKGWINYIANYDGMETMIDYNDTDIIYGIWQNGGLCRSDDGGKTVITGLADTIRYKRNEPGLWVTPSAMDPINPAHIYIGFRNVWKSTNYGKLWSKILDFDSKQFDTVNKSSISIIKAAYNQSGYLAIYKNRYNQKPGELWLTKNSGLFWTRSKNNLPVDSLNISSVEFDPKKPEVMWVSVYTNSAIVNLYKTEDFGTTWKNVSKTLPSGVAILSIVKDPFSDDNIIYAGTNKGVYYTDDNTDLWLPFNENLPITKVNELEVHQITGELFAATYGRGIWKTNSITSVKNQILNDSIIVKVSPNPAINSIRILLNGSDLIKNKNFQIRIYDINGIEVLSQNSNLLIQNNELNIDINFAPGVYFIKLNGDGIYKVSKFVVGH